MYYLRLLQRHFLILFLILTVIYSRFVGLSWGLPYPIHPDERNMVVSVTQLTCKSLFSPDCLNPHFFAYGQLPLYVSYFLVMGAKAIMGRTLAISFTEAALSLRVISAISSVLLVWVMWRLTEFLLPYIFKKKDELVEGIVQFLVVLVLIFSPGLIQFAHFGTTESVLMLFYAVIIYESIRLISQHIGLKKYLFYVGLISGLALATKVSALSFMAVPFVSLLWYSVRYVDARRLLHFFFSFIQFMTVALLFFVICSPYNMISLSDFLGAMHYESDVATGAYQAFYTRQFAGTVPVLFQFTHIFPYALGLPIFLLGLAGMLLLPYNRQMNLLRFSLLSYFLPVSFLFAKWTRFMSPIFPIMLVLAVLMVLRLYMYLKGRWQAGALGICIILLLVSMVPGLAYLSVYEKQDVHFTASEWVYENIPTNSLILSETANVIDIPIPPPQMPEISYFNKGYRYISFNFYDVDADPLIKQELERNISEAEYVFMPSRRVIMNHTCLWTEMKVGRSADLCEQRAKNYPALQAYYENLLSGRYGFKPTATFTSYPKIELLGKTLIEFPDEQAEESWTVFDHPVVRIYKR